MPRAPIFQITETTDGRFALSSSDFDPFAKSFESFKFDGGGYDWERIAMYLLENFEPSLLSAMTFDSEASMFCAIADNRGPLTQLMGLMRKTMISKKRLSIAIAELRSIDQDAFDSHPSDFVVMVYFEGYVPEVETIYESLSQLDAPGQQVVDACCGGGESIILVKTQDVNATVACCLAALTEANVLQLAMIGSKAAHDEAYSVLWPKRDGRILKPKFAPE